MLLLFYKLQWNLPHRVAVLNEVRYINNHLAQQRAGSSNSINIRPLLQPLLVPSSPPPTSDFSYGWGGWRFGPSGSPCAKSPLPGHSPMPRCRMGKCKYERRANAQSQPAISGEWKLVDRRSAPVPQVEVFYRHSVSLLRSIWWNQILTAYTGNITISYVDFSSLDLTFPPHIHFCFLESPQLIAYISGSAFRDIQIKTVPSPSSSPIIHCSSLTNSSS